MTSVSKTKAAAVKRCVCGSEVWSEVCVCRGGRREGGGGKRAGQCGVKSSWKCVYEE